MDQLAAELTGVARQVRTEEAAATRMRTRHLRAIATTGATLAGAVRDWLERGEVIGVETVTGAVFEGVATAAGRDAIAIGATVVPLRSIAAVRGPQGHDVSGDRELPGGASFAALVGGLAGDGAIVAVGVTAGRPPVTGELRSAGPEVLVVREPGAGTVVIPLAQVSELTVLASG